MTGAGIFFYLGEFILANTAGTELSHCFKHADDGEVLVIKVTGFDGAAIDEETRNVQPGHGDHGSGHIFIATSYGDNRVHASTSANCFDGVGDHFATDQRTFHAFSSHGNAITDGDGAEHLWHATTFPDFCRGDISQFAESRVTGGDITLPVGNAYYWFIEILI